MTFDTESYMILEMTETEFEAVKTFAEFLDEYAERINDSNSRLVEVVDGFTYIERGDAIDALYKMNVNLIVRGK